MNFLNLVLSKYTFSVDTTNGFWIKLMAIISVAELKEYLFRQNADIKR